VERLWGFPLTRAEIGVLEWKETTWGADDCYEFKPDLTIRWLRQHGTKLLWSIQIVVISSSYQSADIDAFLQARLSAFGNWHGCTWSRVLISKISQEFS